MSYKIIGDSCTDLTPELKKDPHFQIVPLTLQIGDTQIIDDDTFDQKSFLKLVKSSSEAPKSACPSPELYKKAYECDEDQVFVITLSEHLSGSYSSAVLGKKLYEEEHGEDGKKIAVLGSDSASSGQLNVALYVQSLCQASLPFEEIEQKARTFIQNMKTYFVLETLDTLRKNGRLSGLQAFFATALNIKPVMGAESGTIIKLDQARGINKALMRMADIAIKGAGDTRDKVLAISHCNHAERAEFVKQEMLKRGEYKDVVIAETAGVATVYANDGGIVMTL
ncbi:DegV family protein [Clostridium sp. E02]|uniref:DegV family protein n=1 Tax=Clostridium sp. E02 TaxID=2487134 RepID=UPI000F544E7A|nr:DegV family protein [Clostridium sp. E02]